MTMIEENQTKEKVSFTEDLQTPEGRKARYEEEMKKLDKFFQWVEDQMKGKKDDEV